MNKPKTVKIAENTYWVGGNDQDGGLHCNPYLIVEEEEAVLIDPGSVLDFEYVYDNIRSIVPIEKVKYVILHHQDPDFCSSVPLFEQKGLKFNIITHWRTQTLVKYYGIKSAYYLVNDHEFQLTLKSGRRLSFIQTPYLHFAGAITTYDHVSNILFSSDLFGAFSYEWSLYAGDGYLEKMKVFHEHYMPSNDIIRPVMESLLNLDISMIAPQHGSIICQDVRKYIRALRELECGSFLKPIRSDLAKSGGYMYLSSLVLKRYSSIFSKEETIQLVDGMNLTLDDELNVTDYNYTGEELWNLIFQKALLIKGISWLLVIEPFVQTLAKEYDIPLPKVFESSLMNAEERAENLTKENLLLKSSNERLANSLNEAEYQLTRCPVTGLYNQNFFMNYLSSEINGVIEENSEQNPALLMISVDDYTDFLISYGDRETDELLRNIVYILESVREGNEIFFKLPDSLFACYIPNTDRSKALAYSEKIRNAIAVSEKFLRKITASIGVVCLDELREDIKYLSNPDTAFYTMANTRVRLAVSSGMDMVCSNSPVGTYHDKAVKILLVDTDAVNIDVLKTFLENLNFDVLTAGDGETAIDIAKEIKPSLIISEIMLPKTDGFLFYERLLSQSDTKSIPFFIVSYLKDEASVQRAIDLGVEQYFKKPFMLSELIGAVRNKLKESAMI